MAQLIIKVKLNFIYIYIYIYIYICHFEIPEHYSNDNKV